VNEYFFHAHSSPSTQSEEYKIFESRFEGVMSLKIVLSVSLILIPLYPIRGLQIHESCLTDLRMLGGLSSA
jgi:hypothetical protein